MRKALALWTCPRSVSTAFGVMMMERGDFKVLHEPYGPAYYLSEQRQSDRKHGEPPQPEYNYDNITRNIETLAADGPVFLKDMAYYVEPLPDGNRQPRRCRRCRSGREPAAGRPTDIRDCSTGR